MFRLSSITISDSNQENNIQINIQRTLKLRDGSQNSSWPGAHTTTGENEYQGSAPQEYDQNGSRSNVEDEIHFGVLQAELDAQKEHMQRIDGAGYQIVSALDSAISRIEGEAKKLKDGLSDTQRDLKDQQTNHKCMEKEISSLKSEVKHVKILVDDGSKCKRLEDEIAAAKKSLSSVKEDLQSTLNISIQTLREEHNTMRSDLGIALIELKTLRKELEEAKNIAMEGATAAKAAAKDTVTARAELQQVKTELARVRSKRQTPPSNNAFPSEELEILTRNITVIGNRASQVEPLQMELQLLKGRVQRVESCNTPAANDGAALAFHRHEAAQTGDARRPQAGVSQKRKLLDSDLTDTQEPSSPAKRATLPGWSSSPPGYYTSMSIKPPLATGGNPKAATSPRLTRSGAIDKRTLPRSSKKLIAEGLQSD
jgi:DNA repair exonuclease SbcCD ATPase subunit